MYTDVVDLTPDNVFPVLYLAKKYLLDDLLRTSSLFIALANTDQTIAKVLPHLHLVEGAYSEW